MTLTDEDLSKLIRKCKMWTVALPLRGEPSDLEKYRF